MDNSHNRSKSQQRGRIALDLEHENILEEDERRIDTKICVLYGVEAEEAKEIHANYHSDRLYFLLRDRARKHGMTEPTFLEKLESLNFYSYAYNGISRPIDGNGRSRYTVQRIMQLRK